MLPIVFVLGVIGALALFGFQNSWQALVTFISATVPGYAAYAGALTLTVADELWRLTRRFLICAFALLVISIILMVWGVYRDGSFLEKNVPVALGAMLFGCTIAFGALFADTLERALRLVLDGLHGLAYFAARVALGFLAIFKLVENNLGPRTPLATGRLNPDGTPHRTFMETTMMPIVLLWFWNGMFLSTFPNEKMFGMLVFINLLLVFGGLIVRYERKKSWFWKLTYYVMLPACLALFIIQALFPRPVAFAGKTILRAYDYAECQIEGRSTTNAVCQKIFRREVAEDLEEKLTKVEGAAVRYGKGEEVSVSEPPVPVVPGGTPSETAPGEADLPPPPPLPR